MEGVAPPRPLSQGTRCPWTCPPCTTTARCCATRCHCWATASTGTSSRTARRSAGWGSSDTTSQVTEWHVGALVGTAPREAGALKQTNPGRPPGSYRPGRPETALLLSAHGAGATGTTITCRLLRGDGLRGSGPCVDSLWPSGPTAHALQGGLLRMLLRSMPCALGGVWGLRWLRQPRRAAGTGALPERPLVALLPWSSSSQVLTRRQNCRDEFAGWGWGATLTACEEQRDPVGCPERGSATQTSGFRGRATQAPGRTSGTHSPGSQAPSVAAVTRVTLCHSGPAP